MKIEWLIGDVTSVRPPTRAERELFGMILNIFRPVQPAIVAEEPLCDLGISS